MSFPAGCHDAASDALAGMALPRPSPRSNGNLETEYGARAGMLVTVMIAPHQSRAFAADGQPQAGSLLGVQATPELAERLEQLLCPRPDIPSRCPPRAADSHS